MKSSLLMFSGTSFFRKLHNIITKTIPKTHSVNKCSYSLSIGVSLITHHQNNYHTSTLSFARKNTKKETTSSRLSEFQNKLKEMNLSAITTELPPAVPTTFEERLQHLSSKKQNTKNMVPKRIRDTNRLPSTYCLYVKANWEQAKDDYFSNPEYFDNLYPDVKGRFNLMTAKILSAKWKTMGPEERSKYRDEFVKSQEVRKAEIEAATPEWKLLKKPRPPFILFKMEIFESVKKQFPNMNLRQLNLITAELYRNLPEEKKAHYRNTTQKERAEYYRKKAEVLARTNPSQTTPSLGNISSPPPSPTSMEDIESIMADVPLDYFEDDDTFTKH
ncbi:hypothetical protein C9374_007156 [Naegleria lovaniensis]|uniref:HMG box domain-containing protein n=1 Tax=Naegleria lovaniensis TaxID=51637 RepID=A0AA88KY24_NAELO|nr:uncharacterized protein C9374_007156 [Naegleria lovaniensis]KAG2393625.1 hypothetical protein C9374_007156 [Naegleria lovaniensis]